MTSAITMSLRVLLVEDFEPFRRFIHTTLQKAELQIIAEVSDGLEAVRKAEELQPDLMLLDIGLPTLNGIEAARRIRKLAPRSKILFLSQESSADVIEEALKYGVGYVIKTHAGSDLLATIEAMRASGQFVSTARQLALVPPTAQNARR
jgi:DNA-binding NarL/FixJ family response regulator